MIAVIQRCSQGKVTVSDKVVGEISHGLVILLGVQKNDTENDAEFLVNKICGLRIFNDENDKMNLSIKDVNGSALVISQFTLCSDTKNEVEKLISTIKADENIQFLRIVKAYLHTGARRNELLPPLFTWDNVDFDERKVMINGQKGQSKRFLPMNQTLFELFTEIKDNDPKTPFNFNPDYITKKIAKYYKSAKIKGANTHSLRKTFGSLLIQNNVADIYTVSKLLGHASVKTTEKYYVDLVDDNYKSALNGLDKII